MQHIRETHEPVAAKEKHHRFTFYLQAPILDKSCIFHKQSGTILVNKYINKKISIVAVHLALCLQPPMCLKGNRKEAVSQGESMACDCASVTSQGAALWNFEETRPSTRTDGLLPLLGSLLAGSSQ